MLDLIGFKSDLARGILDGGEDSIFMGDDKHRRFMSAVQEIVVEREGEATPTSAAESADEQGEGAELAGRSGVISDEEAAAEAMKPAGVPGLPVVPIVTSNAALPGAAIAAVQPAEPAELVARGVSFLADLSRTLSTPGGAEAFVAALSETDAATGKTYLKIPVESTAAATGAISMLAGLFSALGAGGLKGGGEKTP
jgi:hypothetical protein